MAKKTAMGLYSILPAEEKMTVFVGKIASATGEQAQGVSQITPCLSHVDQVIQQKSAHAEECAAAAKELASQAKILQQFMRIFRLNEEIFPVEAVMGEQTR